MKIWVCEAYGSVFSIWSTEKQARAAMTQLAKDEMLEEDEWEELGEIHEYTVDSGEDYPYGSSDEE